MKHIQEHHKLLILSKDSNEYYQFIEGAGLPSLSIVATSDPEEAIMLGSDCDLIFGEPSLISQVINRLPHLVWCQSTWAGVEPLLATGLRKNYLLTNARGVYGSMMSEYVFGYLLSIELLIISRWQSQHNLIWDPRSNGILKGKTIGLLGVGTIGAHLAKTAHHFAMRVHGFTRQSETCSEVDRYFHGKNIINFANELDYLVCSLPDTPDTRAMVDERLLSSLDSRVWFINIGRGSVVDEPALVKALNSGSIAGAVLDVFNEEPLPLNHPIWKTPNTYITSHCAARNYLPDIAAIFITNYRLFINRDGLNYPVSFERYY